MKRDLSIIDLFSGCGGLSLGFEMAGFNPIVAIDNWKDAVDTYHLNNPRCNAICGDLTQIEPETIKTDYNIGHVTAIIGGPPCQGFSIAGKRIVDDVRNTLYKRFVSFVKCFSPDAFLMENVPNILSIGEGIVREQILKDFKDLGYQVTYKVLTASDYGVPQNRRRAVFVGLKDKEFVFPDATVSHKVTASEAISDLPDYSVNNGDKYPIESGSSYQELMRKDSNTLNNHQVTQHNEKTIQIISMVPDGGNYKDLPESLQGTRKVHIAWTRLNSAKPSFTIDTGHRHHFHYSYNRIPTVRESARIQSFPDDFFFSHSRTSQYKQVGNAVPPLMAKAIAEELKKQL